MSPACPYCDAPLTDELPCACDRCRRWVERLTPDTGFASTPIAGNGTNVADRTPFSDESASNVVNPAAVIPQCPPLLLVVGSILLCAFQGAAVSMSLPGGIALNLEAPKYGAIAGFLIGLVLAIDHGRFQRALRARLALPSEDPDAPPNLHELVQPLGDWLPIAMLIVPIASALLQWFGASAGLGAIPLEWVGSGAIILTAILAYFSAREMMLANSRHSTYHGALASPALVYLSMLFFWLIFFPVHFVIRWRMGGRNLILPAFLSVAAFISTMFAPFLVVAGLPSADDPMVLPLVKQLLEAEPKMHPVTLTNAVETSFDEATQTRNCQCVCRSQFGEEKITYKIDWQDRGTGRWQVHVLDRLPMVHAPEVAGLITQSLQADWVLQRNRNDLPPFQILQPSQTGYEPRRQQRTGSAIARTQKGDVPITFVIEWHQADRKLFQVRVIGEPPG